MQNTAIHGDFQSEITLNNGSVIFSNSIVGAAECQTMCFCVRQSITCYDLALNNANGVGGFVSNLQSISVRTSLGEVLEFQQNKGGGEICFEYTIPEGSQNECIDISVRWFFEVNYPSGTIEETVLYPFNVCVNPSVTTQPTITDENGTEITGNVCANIQCINIDAFDPYPSTPSNYQVFVSVDGGDWEDGSDYTKNDTPLLKPDCVLEFVQDEILCDPTDPNSCDVLAAVISTNNPTTVCVDDQVSNPIVVALSGGTEIQQWVVTDSSGVIVSLPSSNTFLFEGQDAGTCFIYSLNYTTITGLAVNNTFNDLDGCYAISNSIEITKQNKCNDPQNCIVNASSITTTDTTNICIDEIGDTTVEVQSVGGTGLSSLFLVVNSNDNIIGIYNNPIIDFVGTGAGTVEIIEVQFNNNLQNLGIGYNISELIGCYELSNRIRVIKEFCDGGDPTGGGDPVDPNCPPIVASLISTTSNTVIDALSGITNVVVDSTGGNATNNMYVVADENGDILFLSTSNDIDFANAANGICFIYQYGYEYISGTVVGDKLTDIDGCTESSNAIMITKINGTTTTTDPTDPTNPDYDPCCTATPAEVFTCDETTVCVDDGTALVEFELSVVGEFEVQTTVFTDENGIIQVINPSNPFDFEGSDIGVCLYYVVNHNTDVIIQIGQSIFNIEECREISNGIPIAKESCVPCDILPAVLTSDVTVVCIDEAPSTAVFTATGGGGTGAFQTFIVTDASDIIVSTATNPTFDFIGEPAGICRIYHLWYDATITGLAQGQSINDLGGCFGLSNFVDIMKEMCGCPVITSGLLNSADIITICDDDASQLVTFDITPSTNPVGVPYQLIVTNGTGLVVDTATSNQNTYDFTALVNDIYNVYLVTYTSLTNPIGLNVNDLSNWMECFVLSPNSIAITKEFCCDTMPSDISTIDETDICQ